MSQPHALYRFYSRTGQLLYVGITNNPGNRFQQHQQDKPWWHEVSGISIETFSTREDVLAAETRAIEVERPLHNVQRPGIGRKKATRAHARVGLVWPCETCGKPVMDGTGYIHINDALVATRTRARHAWERAHADDFFFDFGSYEDEVPDEVHWQTHHATCDPEPDSGDYWFGVERARTHAHLLSWTAHLMEKDWLQDTTWDQLIARMAGVNA